MPKYGLVIELKLENFSSIPVFMLETGRATGRRCGGPCTAFKFKQLIDMLLLSNDVVMITFELRCIYN